jgi:hypothetical protein
MLAVIVYMLEQVDFYYAYASNRETPDSLVQSL